MPSLAVEICQRRKPGRNMASALPDKICRNWSSRVAVRYSRTVTHPPNPRDRPFRKPRRSPDRGFSFGAARLRSAQMLAQIEAELATTAALAEELWLRQRAELIRGLLPPRQSPV